MPPAVRSWLVGAVICRDSAALGETSGIVPPASLSQMVLPHKCRPVAAAGFIETRSQRAQTANVTRSVSRSLRSNPGHGSEYVDARQHLLSLAPKPVGVRLWLDVAPTVALRHATHEPVCPIPAPIVSLPRATIRAGWSAIPHGE